MIVDKDVADFIEHFGVRGMKWGVRKDRSSGVSKKTDREASKDAEEFARAKLFYGKGAGTRRKLIKETVDAKKKRDPDYAKAFDAHLEKQDLSKHASGAKKERSRIDRKEKTRQRAGFVARNVTGEMGTQAAFTAAVIGGATFLNSPKGRRVLSNLSSKLNDNVNSLKNKRSQLKGADYLNNYFKRNG